MKRRRFAVIALFFAILTIYLSVRHSASISGLVKGNNGDKATVETPLGAPAMPGSREANDQVSNLPAQRNAPTLFGGSKSAAPSAQRNDASTTLQLGPDGRALMVTYFSKTPPGKPTSTSRSAFHK
jgi:hypothetical protein